MAETLVLSSSSCLSDCKNKGIGNLKLEYFPSDEELERVFDMLAPNGKVVVVSGITDRSVGQDLASEMKMIGFVDVMVAKDGDGGRFCVAEKPAWQIGTAQNISTKEVVPVAAIVDMSSSANAWKMSVNDLADSGLVDEDALLADDMNLPTVSGCNPEAGTGKKRACANCSCGLAEKEALEIAAELSSQTVDEKLSKASGCGGCSRGDAFRCASCPFLGKPAFEPGQEKVVLAMGDDDI